MTSTYNSVYYTQFGFTKFHVPDSAFDNHLACAKRRKNSNNRGTPSLTALAPHSPNVFNANASQRPGSTPSITSIINGWLLLD